MKRLKLASVIIILTLVSMACNLPVQVTANNLPSGEQNADPAAQAAATEQLVSMDPVRLYLSDLPAGYVEISEADLASIGISQENMVQAVSSLFSEQAQPSPIIAFYSTNNGIVQVVGSFTIYPLSLIDQITSDAVLSSPDTFIQTYSSLLPQGSTVNTITGADQIGDRSAGISYGGGGGNAWQDMGVVRVNNVLIVVVDIYIENTTPDASMTNLMSILAQRAADILPD